MNTSASSTRWTSALRNEEVTELLLARLNSSSAPISKATARSCRRKKIAKLEKELQGDRERISDSSPSASPSHRRRAHTFSLCVPRCAGRGARCIDWKLATSPEYRQMMSKYKQIKQYMEPPFLIEAVKKEGSNGAEE